MKHELKKSNEGYFYLEIDGRKIIVDMDKLIGKEIEFDFFAEGTQSPTAVIKVDKNVQVVKMSKSILDYFKMIMDFDNESQEYRDVTEKEFKKELTKALNCGVANKEIKWVE